MENVKAAAAFRLKIPNVTELAHIYRRSLDAGDIRLAGVAEAAAMHVAVAESTIAEASVLRDFVSSVRS